jgi:uncharacterized membrane protein
MEEEEEEDGIMSSIKDNDDDDDSKKHPLKKITETTSAAAAAESHTRSVLKGITWRFVASMTTFTISWYITGEFDLAFRIGAIEVFAKIFIYYLHERLWARIRV